MRFLSTSRSTEGSRSEGGAGSHPRERLDRTRSANRTRGSNRSGQPIWPVWLVVLGAVLLVAGPSSGAAKVDRPAPGGGPARTAGNPSAAWVDQAQRHLQEKEYEVTWQEEPVIPGLGASWHAPNRAQGFRTYFTESGIRVVPRKEPAAAWRWGLDLIGYGRAGMAWRVPASNLSPSGKRINYHRGALREWYENSKRGLKQGFVLPSPPEEAAESSGAETLRNGNSVPGRGRDVKVRDLVHVDLALWGNLSPVIAADGQAIDFVLSGGGPAVRYSELKVTDARGRELPAWMEGFTGNGVRGIRIVVDTHDAVYPLTIDPLATTPAWMTEGNQVSAFFGESVATAGDINGDGFADVIVGAYQYDNGETDEGRAYVYLGSASGLSLTPAWTAEGDQTGASFGRAVATAGDVNGDGFADVIVGAYQYDNGETDEGRAYVYLGSASGLSTTADWMVEGDQINAVLGFTVGTAGDVNNDGFSDVFVNGPGGVLLYFGSASGLSTTPDSTSMAGSGFQQIATAGDVNGDGFADVIAGNPGYDNGETDEGAAFVFLGSASGLSPTPDWTVESNQTNSWFGWTVSTAGDVNGDGFADVIVGSLFFDNGENDEGKAFVYHGSASGLSTSPDWTAEPDQANALFGTSVATVGDVNGDGFADVIVGAIDYTDSGSVPGGTFLYHGSASGLSPTPDWITTGGQSGAEYGWSVATAGDVNGDGFADVIVGAHLWTDIESLEGAAFVYHGSASGPSTTAVWTAEGDQVSAEFGGSVATAGDVNGDGFADLLVGAWWYDNGQTDEGRAFLYLGSASGPSTTPGWTAESDQANAQLGWSVATAGDVNGDGFADVIVGARDYDHGETDEGRAYVYLGSAAGLSPAPSWIAESDQAGAEFGISVATAGDVNGDGYADVIVGAWKYSNGQLEEGTAFVYQGSAIGLSLSPSWAVESNQIGGWYGYSVATAGDVNGDGFADVIVGAYLYDIGESNEGFAFVYRGSAAGLSSTPSWTAEANQISAEFGLSVASAGDVNGDGFADVIVGAPQYDNGETNEGRAYLYLGSSAGLSLTPDWTAESNQSFAQFGWSVATAGDVNGDGYADVVVGTPLYDNGESNEGRVYVYLGSPAGLSPSPGWPVEINQATAEFGQSVSTAGDVNGDGYADVIVGAWSYDNGESTEGAAFLYYGNASGGTTVRPQQRRNDDAGPIAPGGRSRTPGSFRIASQGRSPFGRGMLRLEWEVKPLGTLFDGTGTQQSVGWIDSGTAGAVLNELVSGLEPGAHHWRSRLLYHPSTTPFQSVSRWFTVPWNGWEETDLTLSTFLGGSVWEDSDGDGIRSGSEAGLGGILVQLLDSGSSLIDQRVTLSDGTYRFELPALESFQLKFIIPSGYVLTIQDQGADDTLDSDADPVTGETALLGPIFTALDATRWSAGIQQAAVCIPPDETVFISNVRPVSGTNFVVLDFQDPNQSNQVTGYNIYRSTDPGLDPSMWLLLADDVVDSDEATPNLQYVDDTGDDPPMGGAFYYDIAPYNAVCGAEGPR